MTLQSCPFTQHSSITLFFTDNQSLMKFTVYHMHVSVYFLGNVHVFLKLVSSVGKRGSRNSADVTPLL